MLPRHCWVVRRDVQNSLLPGTLLSFAAPAPAPCPGSPFPSLLIAVLPNLRCQWLHREGKHFSLKATPRSGVSVTLPRGRTPFSL